MSANSCCLQGFAWDGKQRGTIGTLGNNNTYITGRNSSAAILMIHDLFGWTFPNTRLLADHYAEEVGATVYVPDFFAGDVLPLEPMLSGDWQEVDLEGFLAKNGREIREPEIFACAKALRDKYAFVGAVGFCYGGWAAFRLGAREHQPPLVNCISVGHPSLLTKRDIDEIAVPVQVLAPEHDPAYTAELKEYTCATVPKLGVPFLFRHFPHVEHACFCRGDVNKSLEREALVKGKRAVVDWVREFNDELTAGT
ncbi:dienelactone hydrolase family protein [Diaporthe sp. PMI_573]|nr:dienelactone hydrolase family protein [Diaporthaceae sp. PMI_573]